MIGPSFDDFLALRERGDLIPVWREFLFDRDTAVGAYRRVARPPFGFLFESVVGGETWARYTFLGTEPRAAWRVDPGGAVRAWTPAEGWGPAMVLQDPLAELTSLAGTLSPVQVEGLPRFLGGLVGFLAYDAVRYIERLPAAPPDDAGIPDGVFMLTDIVVAIDNLFGRARAIRLVDASGDPDGADLRRLYDDAVETIEETIGRLESGPDLPPLELRAEDADAAFRSTFTRERFKEAVQRVRAYIAQGDAYQVVLSQRLTMPLTAEPLDAYRLLRTTNPSPYLFYLDLDGMAIVGSSPEVMVRLEGGVVTVRPIAGTRPRGGSAAEDARLEEELRGDPKELAEHLMLVDLGRNDVGRVADHGSVRVTRLRDVERYSHVLHLVSQVEGALRSDLDALDVLRACFPAGTVSGAPKVRAMEIIDELEPTRRGPYAGAIGYIGYGGAVMDTAIAIRTMTVSAGVASVQAGAGIVIDSDPDREYDETLAKARALLRVAAALERSGR
ncbi:MAG: anthranilate synthase component I [Gemmatimonadota bacterium]